MSRDRFVELMEDAVIALPSDLRVLLRLVEDPEVDEASRAKLAGGLIHVLSNGAAIPGVRGTLQHIGSVILLRLALVQARENSPEAFARHAEQEPHLYEPLDEQLEATRAFLGDGMKILEDAAAELQSLDHEGHSAMNCVQVTESGTWLYDAVHEALVETVEIDEDDVQREIKDVDHIQKQLARRLRHR